MGKAIIFSGVAVATPIQTVNFVVPLVTGADYVNQYSLLATAVTAPQKTSLTTFVDNLITAGIWNKVSNCFPMLGGLNGYTKDLKDLRNQKTWNLPPLSTTWDSSRNAPYVFPIGLDGGTYIPFTGIVNTNFCLLYSVKQKSSNEKYLLGIKNTDNTVESLLINKNGGWNYPTWRTTPMTSVLSNYEPNGNNIFVLNYLNGTGSTKVKSNNSALLNVGVASAFTKQIASINLSLDFPAAGAAPVGNAFYGNLNMFVVCNAGLTDSELGIISNAINTFNESCGRNTAW